MTVLVPLVLVVGVVLLWRRARKGRAPVARVNLDRLGPDRPMFPRYPTRATLRRRRYRG
jgi:hypothetical protein